LDTPTDFLSKCVKKQGWGAEKNCKKQGERGNRDVENRRILFKGKRRVLVDFEGKESLEKEKFVHKKRAEKTLN